MRKRWPAATAFALLVLGVLGVLWLGPEAVGWSLRAGLSPAGAEASWSHVPASAPVVAALDLSRLLGSPVGSELRPELSRLAALQGADLRWYEKRLSDVVVVHDGEEAGYALGRPFRLSPLLASRFDPRWIPFEAQGRPGATDGLLSLIPLEPGLVLATEPATVARALELADSSGQRARVLRLEEPGLALRALVEITPALRLRLRRGADPALLPVVELVRSAELRMAALDELDLLLSMTCHDEASARTLQTLLTRLDLAARTANQAGGLARALLGEVGGLLAELPPLEIGRTGSRVELRASADVARLRPLLERAAAALAKPGAGGR